MSANRACDICSISVALNGFISIAFFFMITCFDAKFSMLGNFLGVQILGRESPSTIVPQKGLILEQFLCQVQAHIALASL